MFNQCKQPQYTIKSIFIHSTDIVNINTFTSGIFWYSAISIRASVAGEQPPPMIAIRGCDGMGFVMYLSVSWTAIDELHWKKQINTEIIEYHTIK